MTSSEAQSESLVEQRKRFEALGTSLNKASGMRSWFKVLFATTLIFGLPAIVLLSDPLKDTTTIAYQMIIVGFRTILIAMTLYLISKMTPELYTARNDKEKKLEEIGFTNPETNTKDERQFMVRNIMYSLLKIIVMLASAAAVFLSGSRDNYGYIIGQQAVYIIVVFLILITIPSWLSNKPDYSPRLGGRLIVLAFLPAAMFWASEIILGFFTFITEPRFHYNVLQLSYGLIFPFIFLLILFAVLFTTRKTKREKMTLQTAKQAEFERKSSFISEKNIFSQARYFMQIRFNAISQKIFKTEKKEVDLDKKPSLLVVKSIWYSLFLTIIPFALFSPWNLFPQDGLIIIGSLMIAYQFSMTKFERAAIDVIAEPARDETIKPTEIRTQELTTSTVRLIILPTIIFIASQLLMNSVIAGGPIVMSFTWVAGLLVIPLSIQITYNITKLLNENRTLKNSRMYITNLIYVLLFEIVLLVSTLLALFIPQYAFNFTLIDPIALGILAAFVAALVIVPIVYQLIAVKVKDTGFKILKWSTFTLVGLINAGILTGFLLYVIYAFFYA